jgi:hypothetical protein
MSTADFTLRSTWRCSVYPRKKTLSSSVASSGAFQARIRHRPPSTCSKR